jgi:hypothetical protein
MSKVFKEPQVQLVTSKDSKGLKDQVAVVANHHKDLRVRKG